MSTRSIWNAEYNDGKGELLAGDGTRPIVLPVGADGLVLTANSATSTGLDWTAAGGAFISIVSQVFIANGIYTPTPGMKYCIIEVVGGGGGGGASAPGNLFGPGGGGGEYARGIFDAATIGVSQVVTVGAGGASEVAGGTTSVGALISANGGAAGIRTPINFSVGGLGGTGGIGGSFRVAGTRGGMSYRVAGAGVTDALFGGEGGIAGAYSGTALAVASDDGASSFAGRPGVSYGGGGGGGMAQGGPTSAGGAGAAGVVIVTEYL